MPANSADNSAILALPYIQPSQAQKHVTHNQAISALDVLVQLGVVGFGATTPPVDPAEGETHALGAAPTGVWAGQADRLASWRDGVWNFITPLAGWRAWGASEGELRIWDATAWVLPVAGTQNLDGVGINTTSDATNRLSVKAAATLLSHDGDDHQLKINKSGGGDTASVLFQSNWTGHAEMGLNGSTDFSIKVSDDGAIWSEALRFDGASGLATGTAVQSSTADATAGRLMRVGAFGIGGAAIALTASDDLNALAESGMYYNPTGSNTPGNNYPTSRAGSLLNIRRSSLNWTQTYTIYTPPSENPDQYIRSYGAGGWSAWHQVVTLEGNGDFSLYGGTFHVDSSANWVGVGTTNPTNRLHVRDGNNIDVARIDAQHATFSNTALTINASRAANVAFEFAEFISNVAATPDLEFRFSGDGNGTCDGSWTGGGADYAEYFEWADANPDTEDRRGVSVVLQGDKIREAKKGEDPIGVISGNPSVVGDAAPFRWKGKYLRDDYGTAIMEDYEVVSWAETITKTETVTEQATEAVEYTETVVEIVDGAAVQKTRTRTRAVPLFDEYPLTDEAGKELDTHRVARMIEVTRETTKEVEHSYAADRVPDGVTVSKDATRVTQTRRKLNPDYVDGSKYTPREDRPEWDMAGLMGKLRLRKGQVTGARWVLMRKISDEVEEWLVR